jgi:2-dehydropantoate 2-reductase
MHILILGAGALGSLLGGRLSLVTDVSLYSTNTAHMEAIQDHGLLIEEMDGQTSQLNIRACTDPSQLPVPPDLIIVLVKAYATFKAVSSILPHCQGATCFLTLQNGIGNWESIAEIVPQDRLMAGTTALGATFIGPGRVKHGGQGPTIIGQICSERTDQALNSLIQLFGQANLPTEMTNSPQNHIWNKLMVNIGINAITALIDLPNGWIYDNHQARELATQAVQESLEVAQAKGIGLEHGILQRVFQVARDTAGNISSMNQDLRRKRQTEIEAINGAIVRLGKELGIATPVNTTLTNLIKIAETKHRQGGHS